MSTAVTRRGVAAAILCATGAARAQISEAQRKPTQSLSRALAEYAASVTFEMFDAETRDAAKAHLIDALGCGIAALDQQAIRALRELAVATPGPCTLIGGAEHRGLEWATFTNASAFRHFDLNDFYTGKDTGHPSDVLGAVLAVAEMHGRSGQDAMTAMVLAYEVICRMLDGPSLRLRGFDHPAFTLPAVALAAGKLMALSVDQLEQAVNLAVVAHIPLFQTRTDTYSNWKGMADPEAARVAVFAAQLAGKGITGPSPVFEGHSGFMHGVSGPFELDFNNFGGRGGKFHINDTRYKFYPAQAFIQTAVPAAIRLHEQLNGAPIQNVVIETTHLDFEVAANAPEKWAPRTAETADHSLPYVVGRTLLDGHLTVHSYTEDKLSDPALATLLRKTTVHEDPALSSALPDRVPNRVVVTLENGQILSEQADSLPGFTGRPMRREDIETKFTDNVGSFWSGEQRQRILAAAWSMDSLGDIGTFLRSLAPEQS